MEECKVAVSTAGALSTGTQSPYSGTRVSVGDDVILYYETQ